MGSQTGLLPEVGQVMEVMRMRIQHPFPSEDQLDLYPDWTSDRHVASDELTDFFAHEKGTQHLHRVAGIKARTVPGPRRLSAPVGSPVCDERTCTGFRERASAGGE